MKIILVRHGQTEENVKGISQGQIPGSLTEKGIEQAKKTAEYLKDERIDVIYSSDLARTKDTTQQIAKYHKNIPIVYTKELREMGKGSFDGKPREVCVEFVKKSGKPFYECEWDSGESLIKVQKRIKKFYDKIVNNHKDETILIVSHGGVIASLLLCLKGEGYDKYDYYKPKNSAITVLEVEKEGRQKIKKFDFVEHLK